MFMSAWKFVANSAGSQYTVLACSHHGTVAAAAPRTGMLAGGTGITPMWQVINAILKNPEDKTQVSPQPATACHSHTSTSLG